jgi:hypothetical protein
MTTDSGVVVVVVVVICTAGIVTVDVAPSAATIGMLTGPAVLTVVVVVVSTALPEIVPTMVWPAV